MNILTYNVALLPTPGPFGIGGICNGQQRRASLLPAHLVGYDVIVFSEAFHDESREILLRGLAARGYPFNSGILGGEGMGGLVAGHDNGGVIIVSRHPIEVVDHSVFWADELEGIAMYCAGTDCLAQKGVLYARVNKSGKRYHIFGSHTQASYESPSQYRAIREQQFRIMKRLIDNLDIPPTEPVIIAGDLNTDKSIASDYRRMLGILGAVAPEARGVQYTWHPDLNDLAEGSRVEYLDYVLLSAEHALPFAAATFTEVRVFRMDPPYEFYCVLIDAEHRPHVHGDLSDHYAVFGQISYDYSWLVPVLY